jgi:hypothetical protein
MNFRRIIAAATIAGALVALPITLITTNSANAGGVSGVSKSYTTQGGQGGWPLFR